MKKLLKVLSVFATVGEKLATAGGKAIDALDHLVHYKEYRRERRVAAVFRTMLCVACGVLAVIFFPYRIKIEKNGDFDIRSLALHIYRKTDGYDIPEGNEEFDILGIEDEGEDGKCEAIEADRA